MIVNTYMSNYNLLLPIPINFLVLPKIVILRFQPIGGRINIPYTSSDNASEFTLYQLGITLRRFSSTSYYTVSA